MERYFKRKSIFDRIEQEQEQKQEKEKRVNPQGDKQTNLEQSEKKHATFNLDNLPADPGLRIKIIDYHPNDRDDIRRACLQKGPFQPRNHNFPKTTIAGVERRFPTSWYKNHENWLEYSIEKDAVFCLCCYLFADQNKRGGSAFEIDGFNTWNKKNRLELHVGATNSSHNMAVRKCDNLMKQRQHIDTAFLRQSDKVRNKYRTRLTASVDCARFLLKQGLAFRGNDESVDSINQSNFLELLKLIGDHNEVVRNVILENAPENHRLTSPDIQKDIAHAAAIETTNVIVENLQDELFSLLVDESRDVSNKEQMGVMLRYVNEEGCVLERFLRIVHVRDTTALSLKVKIDAFLAKFGLSTSRIRGQGYDGASNMQGEFNGLKSLILRENSSAFYIHCFAHQLQLALVAVAKNHIQIASLFNLTTSLINVVSGSCKRHDMLRELQFSQVQNALINSEICSGRGLNQVRTLVRPGDTRWGSHYGTLLSIITMFSSIVDVLEIIIDDGLRSEQKAEANTLLDLVQSFEFVFSLHLMKRVLGITNELSEALQRKDQDIINAMSLVRISKEQLQKLREDGWTSLLLEVSSFCQKHEIDVPSMDDAFISKGRSRRKAHKVTNMHHYRIELFYTVIDMQLQELNNRFSEANTELLLCVSRLCPNEGFASFDKKKLIRLGEIYSSDFSTIEVLALDSQLDTYICDMCSNEEFSNLKGIQDLAKKMVGTKKNIVYPLVYRLIKLALILPVATASVERTFSAMKIVKNRLRNRIGDQWMNDCLVTYVEKDIFNSIDKEKIIQRFQNMKNRRGQL